MNFYQFVIGFCFSNIGFQVTELTRIDSSDWTYFHYLHDSQSGHESFSTYDSWVLDCLPSCFKNSCSHLRYASVPGIWHDNFLPNDVSHCIVFERSFYSFFVVPEIWQRVLQQIKLLPKLYFGKTIKLTETIRVTVMMQNRYWKNRSVERTSVACSSWCSSQMTSRLAPVGIEAWIANTRAKIGSGRSKLSFCASTITPKPTYC